MSDEKRLHFLDNLRTFLIFLVVLFHAGVVYEKTGMGASWWIVVDPVESDLPGLLNLMLDIFIMPTIFFVSGYLTPSSLGRRGTRGFLVTRVRRLMVPWLLAVLTLIPLYKVIFLHSRGLPQESWTSYFHVSNGIFSMSWLWFLPALFLFDLLYLPVSRVGLPASRPGLRWAVVAVFLAGLAYSVSVGALGAYGWTKTPLIDFQNERLLPYFLVFLLGAVCYRVGVLHDNGRNMKLYIGIAATAWIPMNLYTIVLINFFVRPGEFFVSQGVDRLLLWIGYHLSLLALLYLAVATFKYWFHRQGRLGRELGRLSYSVYILHVVVLGLMALALRATDLPGLVKYPLLALAAWLGSNLIAYAYRLAADWARRGSAAAPAA